jgi:hypothetical protein
MRLEDGSSNPVIAMNDVGKTSVGYFAEQPDAENSETSYRNKT